MELLQSVAGLQLLVIQQPVEGIGVLLTFQNIERIQRIEQKIRSELNSKGLVAKYTFKDILTRNADMVNKNLVNGQKIIVQYKTDGAGEIGRNQVATMKAGEQADHTLLTFNSGDLMPMCKNTNNRIGNFQPIAFLAVDKHLIFIGEYSKYKNFKEVIAALKAGKNIVLGGSKGDDVACHEGGHREGCGVVEGSWS